MNNNHLATTTLSQLQTARKTTIDPNNQATNVTSTTLHCHYIYFDHKQDQIKKKQEERSSTADIPKIKLDLGMERGVIDLILGFARMGRERLEESVNYFLYIFIYF